MAKYLGTAKPVNDFFVDMFWQIRNELKVNKHCPVGVIGEAYEFRQARRVHFKIKFRDSAVVFDYTINYSTDLSDILRQIALMKRDFKIDYWNMFGAEIKEWQKEPMIKKVAGRLGL